MAVAKRAQGAQSSLTMAFETDFGTNTIYWWRNNAYYQFFLEGKPKLE